MSHRSGAIVEDDIEAPSHSDDHLVLLLKRMAVAQLAPGHVIYPVAAPYVKRKTPVAILDYRQIAPRIEYPGKLYDSWLIHCAGWQRWLSRGNGQTTARGRDGSEADGCRPHTVRDLY